MSWVANMQNSGWHMRQLEGQCGHPIPEPIERELLRGDAQLVAQLPDGCAAAARHRAGGHVGVGVQLPQRRVRQGVAAARVGPHPRESDLRRRALLQQQATCTPRNRLRAVDVARPCRQQTASQARCQDDLTRTSVTAGLSQTKCTHARANQEANHLLRGYEALDFETAESFGWERA